jgi:CheY-like chemotaxis protein
MIAAAQTATEIAKQLLTLSGKVVLTSEVLYVNERIKRVIRMLDPTLGPPIAIETNLSADAGKVRMNGAQFDQILLNLVLNARDALTEGGQITLTSSNLDRIAHTSHGDIIEPMVSILVTDTGEGIAPEVRDHIFEPFFTTKEHAKGSGLGLSIVYGIVKDAGGEIIVHSTPGNGASFNILLPRVEDEVQLLLDESAMTGRIGPLQATLLLAEDEPALRELLLCYLQQCGYRVLVAEDGIEALELAEKFKGRIDLLLSDVLMPNMDGITLAQMIALARPQIKVLLMSAYTGTSVKALRDNSLCATFLQKPFALPLLLEKILELTAPTPGPLELGPTSLGLHEN